MTEFLAWLLFSATLIYAAFVIQIILGLLNIPGESPNGEEPPVAVIIAARNEEHTLPGLLEDLLAQDYPGEKFKIYIANDRSTDATAEILESYAARDRRIQITHISEVNPEFLHPKKWALQQCMKLVSEAVVFATDADCRVGRSWISSGVRHLSARTGVLVGYSSVMGAGLFQRYQNFDFMALLASTAGFLNRGIAWSGSGQNLIYRREAYEATGGYKATLEDWSGDDVFIVQSISNLPDWDVRFVFDSDNFVQTGAMGNLTAFVNQRIRWSSYSTPSFSKKPMFLTFLFVAFMTNLLILINLILGNTLPLIGAAILLKFTLEGTVQSLGAWRFKQLKDLALFPLWFLLQPLYIPFMGITGLFKTYSWKS